MTDFAMRFTDSRTPEVRTEAKHRVYKLLGEEIARLKHLQKKNKTIRQEEIEFMDGQIHACIEAINHAKYELQAVRLIIVQ